MSRITFAQTDLKTHEAWGRLIGQNPTAAAVMHMLVANMDGTDVVVIPQSTLARMVKKHVRTVQRALALLEDLDYLEKIDLSASVKGYAINRRVAWTGKRDGIAYSRFKATVVTDDTLQAKKPKLCPLKELPIVTPPDIAAPIDTGGDTGNNKYIPGTEPSLSKTTSDQEHHNGQDEQGQKRLNK